MLMLLLIPTLALGHPEHGFKRRDAEDQGKVEINRLVNEKILVPSWEAAYSELNLSGLKVINGKKRWVMVYRNVDENKESKALIKIITTPLGKYLSYGFIRP